MDTFLSMAEPWFFWYIIMMKNKTDKLEFEWPKLGNEAVVSFLDGSLKNNQVAGAYIFAGLSELGKGTIARALAKNLLFRDRPDLATAKNTSPDFFSLESDFHVLSPELGKKNISVEAVRDFVHALSLSSFLDSYKVGLVKDAELLSEGAANALLKTMEEPREKVLIILLVSNLESLPATIVSRAQILNFYPVNTDKIHDYLIESHGAARSLAKNLASLSLGRPLRALRFLENPDQYERHLLLARILLKLLKQPLAERWLLTDGMISARSPFAEAALEFTLILEIWQGILRDLLILNAGQDDLLQFAALDGELRDTYRQLSSNFQNKHESVNLYLLEKNRLLLKYQDFLAANVSPKNLLDSLVINL